MTRTKPLSLPQLTWTAALIWAFVLAQLAGQFHRIEHARWQGNASLQRVLQSSSHDYPGTEHSCISFDAGTLADAIGMAPPVAPPTVGTPAPSPERACISWVAALIPHFLARAPPVFH